MARDERSSTSRPRPIRALVAYGFVSLYAKLVGRRRLHPRRSVEPAPLPGPEAPAIHAGPVVAVGIGFLVFAVLAGVGLYAWFSSHVQGPLIKAERPFPEPGLAFQDQAARLETQQLTAISHSAWVDRSRGLARIPIEEAMRRIVARGANALAPIEQPETPPGYAKTGTGPIQETAP